MYAQMEKVPVDLRPDNCGIIFDKITNKIIYGILNPEAEASETGKKQIGAFINQGFSVIMASIKEKDNGYFINPAHNKNDIKREFAKHLNKQYGHIRN